jgi:hypothetical protein
VSHQINFKIKIAEVKFQIFIGNNKEEERKKKILFFFGFFADLICHRRFSVLINVRLQCKILLLLFSTNLLQPNGLMEFKMKKLKSFLYLSRIVISIANCRLIKCPNSH